MIINPNLSNISEFNKNNIKIYKDSIDVTFIDENTIKIKKKRGVEFGFIYVDLFNEFAIGSKVAFSGKFELIKGQNARIYFNGFSANNILLSNIGVTRIEAIGNKNVGYNQVQVRIFHDDEVVFRFIETKLEEGDKCTPYLPHKNLIEPSKQAIFLAGGVFQEVYPF